MATGMKSKPGDPLTDRQQRMLDFIRESTRAHGYPPTIREIGAALGMSSPNGVMCHVRALSAKGHLRRDHNKSRGFRLADDSPGRRDAVHAELLACCRLALAFVGPMGPGVRARMAAAVERATSETH